MRIVFVIITGLTLLFIITLGWYVSNIIGSSILVAVWEFLTMTEAGENITSLATFANIIWGPLLDIMVILWMIAAAQQRDVESAMYG